MSMPRVNFTTRLQVSSHACHSFCMDCEGMIGKSLSAARGGDKH